MITAVDTSVLLDVFAAHQIYLTRSQAALRQCLQEGKLVVCDIVIAELRPCFPERSQMLEALKTLDVEFLAVSKDAAMLAGEVWQKYRQAGGQREHLIPDFLIAAHAQTVADRLLTRDRGFYRRWFKELKILPP